MSQTRNPMTMKYEKGPHDFPITGTIFGSWFSLARDPNATCEVDTIRGRVIVEHAGELTVRARFLDRAK